MSIVLLQGNTILALWIKNIHGRIYPVYCLIRKQMAKYLSFKDNVWSKTIPWARIKHYMYVIVECVLKPRILFINVRCCLTLYVLNCLVLWVTALRHIHTCMRAFPSRYGLYLVADNGASYMCIKMIPGDQPKPYKYNDISSCSRLLLMQDIFFFTIHI